MSDMNFEGMALADGVVETIISIAVQEIDGVASVGSPSVGASLLSAIQAKPQIDGIEVFLHEDETISVAVHIEVVYGYVLPEIARRVREAVADAVLAQIGITVGAVDVFIDGIRFE